jgi:hypothetical protein
MNVYLADVLTTEKRMKNEGAKFKLSVPPTQKSDNGANSLLLVGKRTLPSITSMPHTPSQLKTVKKLLVAKSGNIGSQKLHITSSTRNRFGR